MQTYQNYGHMWESIVGLANVRQATVVEENLLQNKGGDSFAQLGASLHDAQAQRNDFGGE